MKISLDTNILIDTPEVVFDKTKEFVISFTVIRELDKLKRNPDLKRAAQQAIKNIWIQYQKDLIEILNIPNMLGESPDEVIVNDTKEANASILSNDIAVRIIAKSQNIEISGFEADDTDYNYTGYIIADGDLTYEQEYATFKEIQLVEFNEIFKTDLKENQYYIINRYMLDKYDIWVNRNGNVHRISQSMKPFRDADILLDPMDAVQMCALDAVMSSAPLVVIDGSLGCLVAGEQLEVIVTPVIIDNKKLYKHIYNYTNIKNTIISNKLKTLRKHKIISEENDLTEFGPSLLIYFKLDKNKSLTFINDTKFNDKYLHFRYWLSYFDYDIEKAYNRVKFLRNKVNRTFFENTISQEYNLDNVNNILKIKNQLLNGTVINYIGSGRLSINYWLFRGWTKEEAENIISNIQKNNSNKKLIKYSNENMKKFSLRCKEYWIEKGYTELESIEKVKEVQSTFSLEKCIIKRGKEKGIEVFNKRQEKWQNTLNKLSDKSKLEIKFKQSCSNSSIYKSWNLYKNKRGLLYYIRFYNNETEFWKIGITSKTVQKRFGSIDLFLLKHKLQYEIIYEKELTIKEAFIEEQRILNKNKKYRTVINYNGFRTTEAFSKDIK